MRLSLVYFLASLAPHTVHPLHHLRRTEAAGDKEDLCNEDEDAIFINSMNNPRPCKWLYRRPADRRLKECQAADAQRSCPVTCGLCPLQTIEGRDCSRGNRCGMCQADCDSDAQCKDGLKCFFRSSGQFVPGCAGIPTGALDYCIDPILAKGHNPPAINNVQDKDGLVVDGMPTLIEPNPTLIEPNPTEGILEPTPTVSPTIAPVAKPTAKPTPNPIPAPQPEPDRERPTPCPPTRDSKWDEICEARERLLECKQKVREEQREGRAAWAEDIAVRPEGRNLRLYCRYSYLWQEKKQYCPRYCLEASGPKSGATLEIKDCSRSSPLQKFRMDNGVIRPGWYGGERLCIRSDKLERCDKPLVYEREGNSAHFEIILEREENKRHELCFSNPHHPKACEPVRFSECKEARNSRTNYWKWD